MITFLPLAIALTAPLHLGPTYPQNGTTRDEIRAALRDGKTTPLGHDGIMVVRPNGDMVLGLKADTIANTFSDRNIQFRVANAAKGFEDAIVEGATYTPTGIHRPETTIAVVIHADEAKRIGLTPENATFYGEVEYRPKYTMAPDGKTVEIPGPPKSYLNNGAPFSNWGPVGK